MTYQVIKINICDGAKHTPSKLGCIANTSLDINKAYRDLQYQSDFIKRDYGCICEYEVQEVKEKSNG